MKRPIDPSELPAGGDARARPTRRRRIPQRGHPTHRLLGERMAARCSRFCCWNLFGTRGRDAGRAPAFPTPLQWRRGESNRPVEDGGGRRRKTCCVLDRGQPTACYLALPTARPRGTARERGRTKSVVVRLRGIPERG